MTVAPERHVVVVDGSNLATEGRTIPSLQQLDEAVRAYALEDPSAEIVVVVDASFEHRIDPSERKRFIDAELHGEVVSPPAGAIGRGDAFVLRIAERTGATVLSNDSFQEFHAEHPWLFDKGRLVGGKPVPGVGWIFTPRIPVRGPKSRQASGKDKGEAGKALSPSVKAAELAKAAKKVAARKALVLPDGSTPKVGDVWPTVKSSASRASADATKKKAKKGDAKGALPKVASSAKSTKAKAEAGAARTVGTRVRAGEVRPETTKKKASAKNAPHVPVTKKAAPAQVATAKKAPERGQVEKASPPLKAVPGERGAPRKPGQAKNAVRAKGSVEAGTVTAQAKKDGTKKTPKSLERSKAAVKKGAVKKAAAEEAETKKVAAKKAAASSEPAAKKRTAKKNAAELAAAKTAPKKPTLVTVTPIGAAKAKAARSTAAKNPTVQEAIGQALAEVIAPVTPTNVDGRRSRDQKRGKQDGKGARQRRRRTSSPPPAVNEPLAFITFVATYPCDSELEGEVVSFTSHGAMVDIDLPGGGVLHSYIPLTAMGDPPPTKARQLLQRGERRRFVLVALDPPRRVAELALPEFVAIQGTSGR